MHDPRKCQAMPGGERILDNFDAAPAGCGSLVRRKHLERQFSVAQRMGRQQLRDPFHVPRRSRTPAPLLHEGVRSLVQQQVATIISRGLFIQPKLTAPLIAV